MEMEKAEWDEYLERISVVAQDAMMANFHNDPNKSYRRCAAGNRQVPKDVKNKFGLKLTKLDAPRKTCS